MEHLIINSVCEPQAPCQVLAYMLRGARVFFKDMEDPGDFTALVILPNNSANGGFNEMDILDCIFDHLSDEETPGEETKHIRKMEEDNKAEFIEYFAGI